MVKVRELLEVWEEYLNPSREYVCANCGHYWKEWQLTSSCPKCGSVDVLIF